jgi:hypothetical protein
VGWVEFFSIDAGRHRISLRLMSKINTPRPCRNAFPQTVWAILVFALLTAGLPVLADESKEDQYLHIYNLIQQGDSLSKNGQSEQALTKYRQAQTALQNFQKTYPDWNAKVVGFRSNDLAQKLSAPGSAPQGAGAGKESTDGTQVKLVDPGVEPRKVLRLHPSSGDKSTMTMTMKMGMEMKMGEMETPAVKIPAMKMVMNTSVKSISPEGDIAYDMELVEASVAEDPDAMAQVVDAMKKSLEGLKGMTGSGVISSRGIIKTSDVKVPAGADAQTRQTMDQMRDSLSKIASPLPEEAVGPGAKWQAKMSVKSQGMTIDQVATYELVSAEDEQVVTKITLEQHAANQKIQNPSMPNVKLDLTKMSGSATGDGNSALTKITPSQAALDYHSEMIMSMNNGGQKQNMTMKLSMKLQMETK